MLTKAIATKEMVLKTFSNLELSMLQGFGKFQILKTVSKLDKMLPLFPSVELAEIAGALIGDGNLTLRTAKLKGGKNKGKTCTWASVSFSDQNKFDREWFQSRFKKIFGVKCKVRISDQSRNPMKFGPNMTDITLVSNSSPIVRILKCVGVPEGNKTVNSFDIPSWISQGDKEIKAGFLRGLFNAEGWISNRRIGLLMGKWEKRADELLNFLNLVKCILKEFQIFACGPWVTKSWSRKDGKRMIGMQINIVRKESVINFKRSIGFIRLDKQSRLNLVE